MTYEMFIDVKKCIDLDGFFSGVDFVIHFS